MFEIASRVCLVVLVATCAFGAEPQVQRIQWLPDGKVEVAGVVYDSIVAWQGSDEFQRNGHRCATRVVDQPSYTAAADCSNVATNVSPQYAPGAVYVIPVVFHVITTTGGVGTLPTSLIESQIDVLNEDFRALAGTNGAAGTDAAIRFELATLDPSGSPTSGINVHTNDTWFNDPGPGFFNAMKNALAWDPSRYLNIYTNDSAGYLGYASFPWEAGTVDDGVVLLWSSVGRNSPNGGIYNLGRTATHEVGHYLGIYHVFQGSCGNAGNPYGSGDLLADTLPQDQPVYFCPSSSVSCATPDPLDNYLNYTQDSCMGRFTPEQVNRMRCALESYRSALYTVESSCELALAASYASGTLNMDFTLGLSEAGSWNLWLSVGNGVYPIYNAIPLPPIVPSLDFSLPLSLPPLGKIGVLTTLTAPGGVICSDWAVVDTGF